MGPVGPSTVKHAAVPHPWSQSMDLAHSTQRCCADKVSPRTCAAFVWCCCRGHSRAGAGAGCVMWTTRCPGAWCGPPQAVLHKQARLKRLNAQRTSAVHCWVSWKGSSQAWVPQPSVPQLPSYKAMCTAVQECQSPQATAGMVIRMVIDPGAPAANITWSWTGARSLLFLNGGHSARWC